MESSLDSWLLDSGESSTVHQLEVAQSSSSSSQDFSSATKLCYVNQDRQYNPPLLVVHQQARRNSISSLNGTSNKSLDTVSTEPNHNTGRAHSWLTEHNSWFRVSPRDFQKSEDDEVTDISTNTSSLGPFTRDLIANRKTKSLPNYMSWMLDPDARYTDALSFSKILLGISCLESWTWFERNIYRFWWLWWYRNGRVLCDSLCCSI